MPTTPIASTRPARDGGPLSQNPPDFPMSDDPAGPISKTSPPSSRIPAQAQSSGIPQRNLSFRERAARGDVKIPDDLDVLPSREAAGPPVGPDVRTPPRSGAGRLKKNSQAEPWPTRVSEPDDIDMTAEMAAPGPQVAGTPARAVPPRAAYPSGYSPSDRARYPPTTDSNTLNDDFAEELMLYSSTGRPTKGPGQGKADQVLGRAPVQTTAGTDGDTSTVVSFRAISPPPASSSNSTAYPRAAPGDNLGPGAPAEPGRRDDTNWPKQQHQQHHMSDVLYHARDKFQPGQGVFKPPTYLDEWRKGTVGVLSGNLLDLDETSTSEKNSGRWDGSQGRRRSDSLSSRPKKAEAFEGEYDEKSNGMRTLHSQAIYPSIDEVQSGDYLLSSSDLGGGLPFEPQHLAPRRAKARAKRWDGLRPFSPGPSANDSQDSLGCFSLTSNDATFSRNALPYSCTNHPAFFFSFHFFSFSFLSLFLRLNYHLSLRRWIS